MDESTKEGVAVYDTLKSKVTEEGYDYGKALMKGTLTIEEFARLHAEQEMKHKQELAEAKSLAAKYKAESGHDVLLERMLNRKRFMEEFEKTLAEADRQNEPYSFMFVDVDQMKELNDQLGGHENANHFLIAIQDAMEGNLRRPLDLMGRYGGDELMVALPGSSALGALRVAENIAYAYADFQRERGLVKIPENNTGFAPVVIDDDGKKKFNHMRTLSFGIVPRRLKSEGDTDTTQTNPKDLMAQADAAMYVAKSAGKDRRAENPTPNFQSTFAVFKGNDAEGKPIFELIDPAKSHAYQEEDFLLAA